MPKYPGISPYDNENGTLGTAKKRWEKLYVKDIESDTINGMHAEIDYLATTAENSVANAVAAKNAAVDAKAAAETAAETAATAAAGIQSVVETDVDNTLSIAGVAADAKVTGDWLRDIAKPVTLDTSMPATAYAEEFMKVTTDSEGRMLYGVKRDGTFTWQKGIPQHVKDAMTPTMENDEYLYAIVDPEEHVLFAIKKDGTVDWQKGTPKHVVEACNPTIENDEYIYLIKDAEDKVLFGIKQDGSVYWQKGLPKCLEDRIPQTTIDSEEFVQLTQDSEGKLIEGVTADGTKIFVAPVMFSNEVKWTYDGFKSIGDGLRRSGALVNYKNYRKAAIIGNVTTGLDVLYLEGNMAGISKDDKVDMNYSFRGINGSCNLKWQGASSIAFPKKNFTINKMNPAIDVGWGTHKKYVLKAEFADFSFARNIVAARIWGEIVRSRTNIIDQKLLASPNCGAIDGFPVMLVINGEYQGIYNFNIPKDPYMLNMGDGNFEAMITAEENSPTTRLMATVSKEDMLAKLYWELEYIPDEDNPDWAIDSLNRMITAVINSTGSNYRATLENYMDIDAAIDYLIFTCMAANFDGISHNYIMCTYDGVKWFFDAYDLDWTFGASGWGTGMPNPKTTATFRHTQGANRMFHLIYAYDREALKTRYWELRNSVLSEENLMQKFANFTAPIPKALLDEETKLWPTRGGTLISNFNEIVNWYRLRVQYMDEEINNL